jgi:hypothetical protein
MAPSSIVRSAGRLEDLNGHQRRATGDASERAAVQFVLDEVADGFEAARGVVFVYSANLDGEDNISGPAGEGFSAHTGMVQPAANNARGGI